MKPIRAQTLGENVIAKPAAQRLGVFHGGFPEAEPLPDLSPLILDGPALPTVLRPHSRLDPDLAGEERHHDVWNFLRLLGEASFVLKELEQDGETQARRAGLVGEPLLLTGQQGPVLDQLVGGPIALHAASLLLLLGARLLALSPADDRKIARNRAAVYHFVESGKGE